MVILDEAIKHPQAPQGMEQKCSDSGIVAQWMRSAVAVLRQSNSHHRHGNERSDSESESRGCERVTAGKELKATAFFQAVFLDLGQSDNGANPDGWAKEQPLKTLRAADIILLECSVA